MSPEQLAESRDRTPIKLHPGLRDIGLSQHPHIPHNADRDPEVLAAEYVRRLDEHPQDDETRRSWRRCMRSIMGGWTWQPNNSNN